MTLVQGPIYQVAWVVEDVPAAERGFSAALGVPRWTRFDDVRFGPDTSSYRGQPADYSIHVSIGYAGAQQIELIQPVRGASLYTEHLDRSGPGLHHVAYLVDDLEAVLAVAAEQGIEVVQRAELAGSEYVYLDSGAGFIELMRLSEEMLGFFASLVPS